MLFWVFSPVPGLEKRGNRQRYNETAERSRFVTFPEFDRIAFLLGSGRAVGSAGYLYRPTHIEQIADLFQQAARGGWTVAPRGAGRSYGDAALNGGQVVLDLQRMNRILDW